MKKVSTFMWHIHRAKRERRYSATGTFRDKRVTGRSIPAAGMGGRRGICREGGEIVEVIRTQSA